METRRRTSGWPGSMGIMTDWCQEDRRENSRRWSYAGPDIIMFPAITILHRHLCFVQSFKSIIYMNSCPINSYQLIFNLITSVWSFVRVLFWVLPLNQPQKTLFRLLVAARALLIPEPVTVSLVQTNSPLNLQTSTTCYRYGDYR